MLNVSGMLAKDGVYVDNVQDPSWEGLYGPGNRVDVVIRCAEPGLFTLSNMHNQTSGHAAKSTPIDNSNILTVKITTVATLNPFNKQTPISMYKNDLPRFFPYRPHYLADIINYDSPNEQRISFATSYDYANKSTCTIAVGINETKFHGIL